MKDNYRFYEVNGEEYKIGDWESSEFEKDFPTAKVNMSVNGENYLIGINERDEFMKDFAGSEVSYTNFGPTRKEERQARREERQNDGKTTFGETLGKSAAAAGVRTGKLALDLARAAWNTGVVGGAINFMTGKKFDEKLQDEGNRITQWSTKLGETADRLSREADPTGGEKGYVDLIKEGNIGQVAQKALASGIESLPMMLAAGSGWGMLLYGAGMAAGEYSDETRENPDIPSWKRAINSMGSAALEMAVEKIGGPLNDLGKAGKEITEDMAKEILETAVKEGSDHIAKRIVKKLGTMVKQGAEEGVEEVVTSFGNDVLGTSLDLIDGDADYGIQAQWNQLKEQNPDASLADFAKEKGKEYMDAFIGGAVSGLEISTTTEGLGAGVNALRNNESRNIMQHAREVGSSMTYDNLYDTDSDVANAKTAVANSFADKDGNPTISNEFIESLSAEDAYALAGREDFSYQQRRAFGELAIAKAKSDALNGRLDTMRDERVATIRSRMEKASENGQIVTGMVDGRVVYVRGGKVNNREVSVDKHGGHGPLLVIDSVTGEEKVVNSKDITSASVLNAEETINGMVNFILNNEASDRQTARTTMSKRAKIAAVNEFIGKRMMINSENGIIEVEVTSAPQSGKVLIKGKKGDLGGQAIKPMDADVFYDSIYRNENGEPVFVEKGEGETEDVEVPETPTAPETPEAPVAAGVAEDDDFRDFTGTILVDGAPLNVSVISQDGPSDTIVYEYEDENGNTRRASTTIGAFKTAVQQGAEYAQEAPVVPETPVAETPVAEEVPPTEETPTEEEAPVVEVELGPDDIDWDALFDSDPEAYFVELQKQFGDGAIDMLTAVVEATQEELDGLNKNKGKTQKEIFANVTKKKALQNKIDILNGMIERLTAAPAPETAPEVVPDSVAEPMPEPAPATAPVVETPAPAPVEEPAPAEPVETEPVEEPAPVTETPKFEIPDGGFIMEDGYIVNPIVIEMPGVEGESNKIYLAEHNGKWGVSQYAVMDNGSSSGSEKNGRVQKEWITYDTPEEAIVKALKYFDFYRKDQKRKSTSEKIDTFMQWIKDTYLKDSGLEVPEVFIPEAPNPVDDPIKEAKKREKSLATQLKRIGIPHEQKQDMAFNAGKAVADMFATREEYEDYAEDATDFGEYNADFERGVDFSFANRPQNPDDTPGKSVPLENEPKGGENGGETDAPKGDGIVRPADGGTGGGTDNGGSKAGDKGNPKAIPSQGKGGSEGGKESGKVKHQYPARKGNVTGKILVDTFGLAAVDIPNSRKEILNTFYDFMMEMSKILGISPKSIGNGGWLTLGNLRSNARAFARHTVLYKTFGGDIVEQHLLLKYSRVSSIAHEWWHALDHALSFFEKGKNKGPTTEIATGAFDGRQETLEAVRAIMQAIRDSGYTSRIQSHPLYTRDFKNYVLEPTESAARAFAEYMRNKFAENGIAIAGVNEFYDDTQPTAEEMKLITPAIENLFKVLQEKEGKTPGTSILYHIGEMMDEQSDAKKLATEAVLTALDDTGIDVVRASDEQTQQMIDASGENTEFMISTDNPVFVSNAAMAVAGIKMEKATPEQWLKMIEKAGGLKAGEDKWIGLSDWLKASDKKTLTKKEVLDYIHENEIKIEEVNYAEIDYFAEDKKIIDAINAEFLALRKEAEDAGEWIHDAGDIAYQQMVDKYGDDFSIAFGIDRGELYVSNREAASAVTGVDLGTERAIDETRIGYTTEGLSNNKEIALVVPTIESWNESDEIHFGDAGNGRAVAWVRFGETEVTVQDETQQRLNEIYDRLAELEMKVSSTGITEEEYNERARLRTERDELQEIKPKTQRVLVIDEIQSKRHQEGRESGYKVSREKADAEMDKFMKRMHEKYEFSSSTPFAEVFNEEEMRELARLTMQQHRATFGGMSVPDAPFDKNWHELAMKRMLRYAAENGYDAIAWTKGEQQAERYDIGSVVTAVDYRLNDDGTYRVDTMGALGYQIENVPTTFTNEQELADVFGKEIAKKIVSNLERKKADIESANREALELREKMRKVEDKDSAEYEALLVEFAKISEKRANAEKGFSLSETDFRIGGEGMKGFYDKMLPAFMNKYGKKWGVKVADITLPNVEEAGRVMHSVPVNDAMKESVMEGQPMFMKRPNGTVYGWTDGKKIYLTKAGINPNTPVHEYTHLWAKAMMQKNPKGWQSIKDLLRGTPVWNEVLNDPNYSSIHSNEDLVASEVLSRISGTQNAAKLEQMAQQMIDEAKGTARKLEARGLIQNIKDALNKFWNWVGTELFGIEKFESVEQITDRVLWDLMNKTDLGELSEGNNEYSIIRGEEGKALANAVNQKNLIFKSGQPLDYIEVGNRIYLYENPNYNNFTAYSNGEINVIFALEIDAYRDLKEIQELVDIIYGNSQAPDGIEPFIEEIWSRHSSSKNDMHDASQEQGGIGGNDSVYARQSELNADNGEGITSSQPVTGRVEAQNAAVDFLVGEPRLRAIENAVNEEASKLGVKVTYKTREQMPEGHKNDKGYYDTKTGEIVICTENASSIADAIQTILHEAVAHKGLRQLMGDKFNEFINRVYDSLDAETKAKVDALAEEHYDGNKAVAMEEYMATLAETADFADNSVWSKIKSIFEDIINAILGRNDIKIGDNELRYILRASYNNMVNPRNMETVRGWAQDQMMREEYKINEATPDILSRTGIDPDEVARETAKAVYERIVNENWQEFQRQFQDAMQPVRIAIDAIQQETGNLPIEDYENFLLMFNQASSRSRVEIDDFSRRYYSPIIESINEIVNSIIEARGGNTSNKNERAYAYQEIMNYLIAKHGLERNKYYQSTKTRKLTEAEKAKAVSKAQKAYDDAVDAINVMELTDDERADMLAKAQEQLNAELEDIDTREVPDMRDYSGLTSLFGFPPKKFKEAEDEAQRLVDDFERMLGRVDDESGETVTPSEQIEKLWKNINAATSKTLRHSYESGMLSRQQYNDIKDMFKFYIPLRGFDETTAEDVYTYARFEGNRFNPAVHKAKGRTSVADDPIATIMNMAESEIAQGNKNRAKQALYNFLLNRAAGKAEQNSLMQVESVWYLVKKDELDNEYYEIAVPNRDAGETYEEFEERMKVLEAEEKAVKSKKGKLNIGMRFQKPANMSAHYVFLKVNGVEKAIYINGDPKAAQAINGEHKKKRNELVEKMGALNRFISSMFTNYSLEFTARNFFRDMFYSHINIDVKESDPAYRKKFRQNWRHNNLGSMVKMLKAYRAGEYEGRDLNEDEKAFVEFMRNGGQTGYTLINSVETHKKDLERAIANMQKGVEKGGVKDSTIFKFTLGSIELLNEASELVTRFAAFKTSRDMGRGINTSIADAKEVTVNFNTKGAQDGKGVLGWFAQYFGWSKYFFNASVQGVQNLKSMAEANKLKFGSVIGGMIATGFLMPVITSAIASLFGNDDEEYWNIPEYERQNNFCVPIGNGKYVKVPLPIGFREVYAIGDMVAGAAFNKKFTRDLSQVGTDIANKLASIILPINPLESTANGLGFWHMFAYTTLPSFAQVAIQNMTNTDWKGAPLQKEYTYNEDDPQWMKAFASNPDWMKGLSKWCNEHINLDGDYKGMDWSPEQLDNTLSNVLGGIYSLVKKTGKSISMIWNEENRNLSNIPLSGVVLGSGIDNDDRFVTDAYYDMKEYYDSNVNYIKRMAKRFGYDLEDVFEKEKGKHHPKMNEIYSNENFDFMQEWYTGVKELDAINDKIKKLDKKIAAKETPTEQDMLKWSRLNDKYMTERRDFVNDMLELD